MSAGQLVIRSLNADGLDAFFAHLDEVVSDNGKNGTPLFQPTSRAETRYPADKRAAFAAGLALPLGRPGWRRAWILVDGKDRIAAHVDLRARPEGDAAAHRAQLGMSVHRDWRYQGLGRRLVDAAVEWATGTPMLEWIDLEVVSENRPARALYLHKGFSVVGEYPDMFRVDGAPVAYTLMTRRLERAAATASLAA